MLAIENDENEFNTLVDLHAKVKNLKTNESGKILEIFKNQNQPKFNKIRNGPVDRRNLSSTATCTYVLVQYAPLWKETGKTDFKWKYNISNYWKTILDILKDQNIEPIQAPDEFSVLNILSVLTPIREVTKIQNDDDDKLIYKIIERLCTEFIENQFIYGERGIHPFVYFKFMKILEDWGDYFGAKLNERLIVELKRKYGDNVLLKCKDKDSESFHWFLDKIYNNGKYEMYRQIALYYANDKTLFDVKRLVYSLLIVTKDDHYSNNMIIDKALEIIFKEQLETGLLPIGHVVDNDFVVINGQLDKRIVSASPLLLSFECFNDLLSEKAIHDDLKKYQGNFKRAYDWVEQRLRKTQLGESEGWFPEYESTHIPESWVAGHVLLFLKKYCEFLSELMSDIARSCLHAKQANEIEALSTRYDTYGIKTQIDYMCNSANCCSALVFGPPGTGKTTIAKYITKALSTEDDPWYYIEITPGLFLAKGEDYIIPKANEIFQKLSRIKKAVILFDEVDQLVKSRQEGGPVWIVTALLPKFAELRKQKEIKFLLATNLTHELDENKHPIKSSDALKLGVDPAIIRLGRIDLILPMGSIDWHDRIKMVREVVIPIKTTRQKKEDHGIAIAKVLKHLSEETIDSITKTNLSDIIKDTIVADDLQRFLYKTDFMSALQLKQVLNRIFLKKDETAITLYKTFFKDVGEDYTVFQDNEFQEFHDGILNKSLGKEIRLPLDEKGRARIEETIKGNVFR